MLRPIYTQRAVQVLLLGPSLSGKRTLASELLKCPSAYFSISTAENLSKNPMDVIDRIDYILFMLDMTNRNSLTIFHEALKQIPAAYLYNKCGIVFTRVDAVKFWTISEKDVTQLTDKYTVGLPRFRVNLEDENQRSRICDQIARAIKIAALQQKNVSGLLLRSLEHYHPITTKVIPTPAEHQASGSLASQAPMSEAVNSIADENANAQEPSVQGDRISEGVPVAEPSVDIDIMSETG
ncbi:hypothetical protein O0I10_008328 [Lichtheimia ornata]|uniref:Centromere protein M n=1 Tax=Lichtheimia ornata TaxID=688661 RepID=A0AAD7UZI0_9FUNG|nr:uncharacterized protein O0I10_008328 [Lichtheimia ornata]KAJ8655889.1 hypothetical protein O0I10_008328 [Lichtheimia ornata]